MFYKIGQHNIYLTKERDEILCKTAERDDIKGEGPFKLLSDETMVELSFSPIEPSNVT